MNAIMKPRIFIDTGSYQREKEDLSYYTFKNLNFNENTRHISFFRSDFRGSNFRNVKFHRNNFDRADFISCNICNCSFEYVDFGSCEIKNCYFEDVEFKNNKYNGPTIHQSTFVNCHFCSEQFLVSMYDCKLIGCKFSDCRFEQSSTEKLDFLHCEMVDTDFATMHAEKHTFISCELKRVCLGVSYIYGYLIYDTNITGVDLLYRGERVHIDAIEKPYDKLEHESRYFELINAYILCNDLNNISEKIIQSIESLCSIDVIQFRQIELNNILTAICFYARYSMLPFIETIKILDYLDQFNWQQFTLEETLNYLGKAEMIKHIMSAGEYQWNNKFINTIPYDDYALVSIQCNTDNYDEALAVSGNLIETTLNTMQMPKKYCLIDQRQGSWELTFLIPLLCAMMLPTIFRTITGTITEFSFKRKFGKVLLAKLNDDLKINQLKSIAETATSAKIVSDETNNLSEIISSVISDVIKSIKIGI